MKYLFWDSSALVKILHKEEQSPLFLELFNNPGHYHFASLISRVEMNSAIRRKLKEQSGNLLDFNSVLALSIKKDLLKKIVFLVVDSEIIKRAEEITLQNDIKTLDSLILATYLDNFQNESNSIFISADGRQNSVAKSQDIEVIEF